MPGGTGELDHLSTRVKDTVHNANNQVISATACSRVSDFEGRPACWPLGVSTGAATFRPARSSRLACRAARTRTLCAISSVRVDRPGAIADSAPCTSAAVSSVSLTVPSCSVKAVAQCWYEVTVRGESPSSLCASQSWSASPTVERRRGRSPTSSSLCSSLSLSRTSTLVLPLTFLRMRVPAGLRPRSTAPIYRLRDASRQIASSPYPRRLLVACVMIPRETLGSQFSSQRYVFKGPHSH
jgi:hypothetical protein